MFSNHVKKIVPCGRPGGRKGGPPGRPQGTIFFTRSESIYFLPLDPLVDLLGQHALPPKKPNLAPGAGPGVELGPPAHLPHAPCGARAGT